MRILAGKVKGRKILTSRGRRARPTLQVVRKSIFDILGERVKDACVLDLFAGSGSLGLEALSRGSREVTFVDRSREALGRVKQNAELFGFHEQVALKAGDGVSILRELHKDGKKYGVVFVDPPYESDLTARIVRALRVADVLAPDGVLVLEHSKQTDLPEMIGSLSLSKTREFGRTCVSFYQKEEGSS